MSRRFAVVSSTNASVVKRLYEECDRENFYIDLLVTDRECGASNFSNLLGIETRLIKKESNSDFSNELLRCLDHHKIDYVYLFFTRQLLGEIVDRYARRIINFHPALLPAFPGLDSFDKSVKSGSILIGSTVHYIDHGLDTGEQILQSFNHRDCVKPGRLRHIILAQQCASLYFIHRRLCTLGLDSLFPMHNVDLSQGFLPNLDSSALDIYRSIMNN